MAIDLEAKSAAKYETVVNDQLAKARGRIRALDAGSWFLVFLVVAIGYGVVVALADRAFELSTGLRLAGFLVFLLVSAFLLTKSLMCLLRQVNPYYAALQLEETLPDAKNSLVNWLDLRDKPLPPVIRGALGTRAATDIKQTDPDQAIGSTRPMLLGIILGGLFLGLVVLFLMGPNQFFSLMSRAFAPFREVAIEARTSIALLEPASGNLQLPFNRGVPFRAQIDGRVPKPNQEGAPRLLYRYNLADQYVDQKLEQDPVGNWATEFKADQVQGGFWYKIAAGDAETPEYQVTVKALPVVTQYEVTYKRRPYLVHPDRLERFPNEHSAVPVLIDLRGTEATLIARTTRKLRFGSLEFDFGGVTKDLLGEILPDDPHALRFKFIFENDAKFRVRFTSTENEENANTAQYSILVRSDGKPRVELTKPAKDIDLPANGTLQLEGVAGDEFGVKAITLKMRLAEGAALQSKPYRPEQSFKLVNGSYPQVLQYKDFVALEQLKNAQGAPFPLAKGMKLEYWLEAVDNSDYPDKDGQVGESKHFFVNIIEPEKDQKKQEQDRAAAKKEQQQHEQNQNNELDKQNEQIKNDQETPEQRQKREELEKQIKELNDRNKNPKDDPKAGPKDKQNPDGKPDPKDGNNQNKQNQPGEAKGTDPNKGEQKPEPKPGENGSQAQAKPKDSKNGPGQAGDKKDEGQGEQKQNPAQARDGGADQKSPDNQNKDNQNNQDQRAEAKGPGQESQQTPPKASAKDNNQQDSANNAKKPPEKGAAKNEPQEGQNPAQCNNPGSGGGPGKNSAAKPGDSKDGSKQGQQADNKGQGQNQPGAQAKDGGQGDPQGQPNATADAGQSKSGPPKQETAAKPGPSDPKMDPAQAKPGHQAGDQAKPGENIAGKAKGDQAGKDSPKSAMKNGDKAGQPQANANAKEGPKSDPKTNPQGTAQGKTKNGQPDPSAAKAKGSDAPARQPTAEELAKWAKELKADDQSSRDEAKDALNKALDNIKDPQTRKDVEDALAQAARDAQAKPTESGDPKTAQGEPKQGPPQAGEKGDGGAQARAGKPGDQQAEGKGAQAGEGTEPVRDPRYVSNAKGGTQAGNFGPNARGISDDAKAQDPMKEFHKLSGELSLEKLKDLHKKAKDAGWTDQQWQQFLRDAQAHNEWVRKAKAEAAKNGDANPRRGTSILPSVNPYQVGAAANQRLDPLQSGQPQPPPEFRQAQRIFTTPEATAPKK